MIGEILQLLDYDICERLDHIMRESFNAFLDYMIPILILYKHEGMFDYLIN